MIQTLFWKDLSLSVRFDPGFAIVPVTAKQRAAERKWGATRRTGFHKSVAYRSVRSVQPATGPVRPADKAGQIKHDLERNYKSVQIGTK